MKTAARLCFWWLGMDGDINQERAHCKNCNQMVPSNVCEPTMDWSTYNMFSPVCKGQEEGEGLGDNPLLIPGRDEGVVSTRPDPDG